MSLDRSLKSKSTLVRHRNVLSRAERLAVMEDDGRWTEDTSIFGLPKVLHRKLSTGKKEKKEKTEGDAAAAPAAAAGAAAAPAAKAGAPAAKAGTPAAGATAKKK